MPKKRNMKIARQSGFYAALRVEGTWVYYETVEDASEAAMDLAIDTPKIIDLTTEKRVLA